MAQRKFLGMHVGQFGVNADPDHALDAVPANVVASLNTHDTATFMGFWQGEDIDDRVDLGLHRQRSSRATNGTTAAPSETR